MSLIILTLLTFAQVHFSAADSASEEQVKYVDLSYSFGNSTVFYPGSKGYTLSRDQEGYKKNGEYW